MELPETIACVHEAMEGRYKLTGQDLYDIHYFLCEFQPSRLKEIKEDNNVIYKEAPLLITQLFTRKK